MLDDPSAAVRALPGLRAYDRREIEAFLAAAEAHERHLREQLAEARRRRSEADRRAFERPPVARPPLSSHLDAARAELDAGQAEHEAAVAALDDAARDAARQILVQAEREALASRRALTELLARLGEERWEPAPPTVEASEQDPQPWPPAPPPGPAASSWPDAPIAGRSGDRPAHLAPPVQARAVSGWALQPTRGVPPWLRHPTTPMLAARW